MSLKKIGTYRLIPAGTTVFSISLQENIKFEKDIITSITNTVYFNDDFVFGTIQTLLFNLPGYIPTLISKNQGDISFKISDTKEYNVPEALVLNFPLY